MDISVTKVQAKSIISILYHLIRTNLHDECHYWSRNCSLFRSTWVHPRFLVGFVLFDLLCESYQFFPYSWHITGFVTRVTRSVSLMKQELLTLPEHLSSPPVFSGFHVVWSLFFCVLSLYLTNWFIKLFDKKILIWKLNSRKINISQYV
jgi:hypothetical protein